MKLSEFDAQVLKEIKLFKKNDGWVAPREIELIFGDDEYEDKVKISLTKLLSLKYIKGHGSPDPDGSYGVYCITPQGKSYLEELGTPQPIIGNITNSNVAINSSNIIQELKITDPELKEKIKELESAIKEKNPSMIKKAFGYIADKAVGVAITLLLKGMGN